MEQILISVNIFISPQWMARNSFLAVWLRPVEVAVNLNLGIYFYHIADLPFVKLLLPAHLPEYYY